MKEKEKEKQLPLVTFEQAVRLKRSGFDWECDHLYVGDMCVRAGGVHFPLEREIDTYSDWNNKGYDRDDGVEKEWISAPSVAPALKWLRDEKYMIYHVITKKDRSYIEHRFMYWNGFKKETSILGYVDYEAAESALSDELLTVLENMEKR
jgi:hypothetical protein